MCGGLISDGTRTTGGPLAAMIAQGRAADLRRRSGRGGRGALRGAAA